VCNRWPPSPYAPSYIHYRLKSFIKRVHRAHNAVHQNRFEEVRHQPSLYTRRRSTETPVANTNTATFRHSRFENDIDTHTNSTHTTTMHSKTGVDNPVYTHMPAIDPLVQLLNARSSPMAMMPVAHDSTQSLDRLPSTLADAIARDHYHRVVVTVHDVQQSRCARVHTPSPARTQYRTTSPTRTRPVSPPVSSSSFTVISKERTVL
jgi:hypothetical protein